MKRTEKLSRKARYGILAAIMAGAFSIMPAAQAMPTGGASGTATITTTGNNTMEIASSVTNNLLTWQDFSIAKGETVNFGGSNTYLNVVTGNNASEIYGAITGSAANVYLINPNGILFGDEAQVNVGSLHLSTADISGKLTDFDTALDALNGTDSFGGDIVNKGTLTAAQEITVDGNNITFKNTADVSAASVKLTAKNSGEIHIGSADGATPDYTMNGTSYMYKLVSTAEDLQNINNLSGNYMLANDITLTAPADTASGSNFTPIGGTHWNKETEKFTGRFDGLNYTIDNLYINPNTTEDCVSAGLFAAIGRSGVVENLTLGTGKSTLITNRNGYNGSFAGLNDGILRNVVNNGVEVTGSNYSSGGIVGYNCRLIDGATNKAAVTTKVSYSLGGIVGENDGRSSVDRTGIVRNSRNTGEVANTASSKVGGIVGNNLQGTLQIVSNSGTVTGSQNVGGIAGLNNNEISNAANTGTVQGKKWVGGVIGYNNQGTLTNAYNIGSISISNPAGPMAIGGVGGVVGANEGIVTNVYNEGTVSGFNINGGVVGLNGSDTNGYGVLRNAYNTGTVRGTGANTGGIVGLLVEVVPSATANGRGYTTGSVENVYNTGEVTSTDPQNSLGAIVGQQKGGTISGAYYLRNLTTGVGGGSRSTTQVDTEVAMKQATTFADFSIDKDGSNSSAVWRIYEGKTMPLLTAFLTPLTLADTTVVYDGQAHSVASLSKVDSSKILVGTLSSYTKSGTYTYTGLKELYSDQQGYNIKTSGDTATLTINKAPLTINFEPIQKQYDGTTNAVAGQGTLKGVLGKDNVSYAADVIAVYDSKNAGTRTVNYSGIKLTGADAGNYSIEAAAEGKGTITAAPLTLTVADITKEYDGTTEAPNASYSITNGQLFGEDTITGGSFAYEDKSVGTGKTVTLTGVNVSDGNEGQNYTLTIVNSTNSAITANAPTAVVSVMADRLEAAGTSLPKMEEVIAVAAPAPAATVPTPAAIEPAAPSPAVQSEDEQQSDNVETAATTATTHGDDHANAPAREKPVHNALGKDGVLTMVNEGVNPPESMSAENVAQQNKNTNGNNKEGE